MYRFFSSHLLLLSQPAFFRLFIYAFNQLLLPIERPIGSLHLSREAIIQTLVRRFSPPPPPVLCSQSCCVSDLGNGEGAAISQQRVREREGVPG